MDSWLLNFFDYMSFAVEVKREFESLDKLRGNLVESRHQHRFEFHSVPSAAETPPCYSGLWRA